MALVAAGMNDVLNAEGFTQAAWWNRIPGACWGLRFIVATLSNLMIGYGTKSKKPGTILMLMFPLVLATAFLLIADIDSPRGGLIHVQPKNLQALIKSPTNSGSAP